MPSIFQDLDICDLKLITPLMHEDDRGLFCETYNSLTWEKSGLIFNFVQDNHSLSRYAGTVRGLHYQTEPYAQDKLVRVVRGRILDIAVDIRKSSRTYGRHVAVQLSKDNSKQLFIPKGFAHGFITLEPNTEVFYKVTNFYSAAHDFGIVWNDPDLGIPWGINSNEVKLSNKDKSWPRLRDIGAAFP